MQGVHRTTGEYMSSTSYAVMIGQCAKKLGVKFSPIPWPGQTKRTLHNYHEPSNTLFWWCENRYIPEEFSEFNVVPFTKQQLFDGQLRQILKPALEYGKC